MSLIQVYCFCKKIAMVSLLVHAKIAIISISYLLKHKALIFEPFLDILDLCATSAQQRRS